MPVNISGERSSKLRGSQHHIASWHVQAENCDLRAQAFMRMSFSVEHWANVRLE
jgi:hypothetical protein